MDMDFGSNLGSPKGLQGSVRRIPTFTGTQYGTFDTPIVFTGDFEVEVEFATTDTAIDKGIFGDSITATDENFLQANDPLGNIAFRTTATDTVKWAHLEAHRDGKVHKVIAYRVGSTIGIKLDGVTKATLGSTTVNDVVINLIGCLGLSTTPSQFFKGEILSAKFTDKSSAEDVITNYVFDSGSDLYQMVRGEVLGDNILTGDTANFDATIGDWTTTTYASAVVSSGEVTITTLAGISDWWEGMHLTITGLVIGKTYRINLDRVGGAARYRAIIQPPYIPWYSTDKEEIIFTATSTSSLLSLYVDVNTVGHTTVIASASINQLPDSTCLLTAFTSANWSRYTLQRNIIHDAGTIAEGWVGDNVVVNGRFDADTDWLKGIGWTIADGVAFYTSGSGSTDIEQTLPVTANQPYLTKYTLRYTFSDNVILAVFESGGTAGGIHPSDGSYTEILNAGTTGVLAFRSQNLTNGSVDNISAQHLLEVAQ